MGFPKLVDSLWACPLWMSDFSDGYCGDGSVQNSRWLRPSEIEVALSLCICPVRPVNVSLRWNSETNVLRPPVVSWSTSLYINHARSVMSRCSSIMWAPCEYHPRGNVSKILTTVIFRYQLPKFLMQQIPRNIKLFWISTFIDINHQGD